jgi:hypothetical protein
MLSDSQKDTRPQINGELKRGFAFIYGKLKRGEASLTNHFPFPLSKGKGTGGIGLPN